MSQRYRVASYMIDPHGDGFPAESVLWVGTFEELRAKYGDDPDANPITLHDPRDYFLSLVSEVLQKETKDGWQECADPRKSL